jgi:hypothetical protein
MAATATDLTCEHYQRPEVKEIVLEFCQDDQYWRPLNGDKGWYKSTDDGKVRLRRPEDYDNTTRKYRTLYALLDLFEPTVKDLSSEWDEGKNRPVEVLGTFREEIAYTLGADIDSISHDLSDPAYRTAVEDLAEYLVSRLNEAGIKQSVHCLLSGGGVYVFLHHNLCRAPAQTTPEDRFKFFSIRTGSFKLWLADVENDFFELHPEYVGKTKIDKLTNQKRKFKAPLSIHAKHDIAVIPLDPANIKIDLARAKLPLSDEVLQDTRNWYKKYDPAEIKALDGLLEGSIKKMHEEMDTRNDRGEKNGEISRMKEPLARESMCPLMQNIAKNVAPGNGPHRALAVMAAGLYQFGWDEDKAFEIWQLMADKCGVESRIFELWFGQMSMPNCATIQRKGGGYPELGMGDLGYCKPDEHCKGCVWPGDYHIQKILNENKEDTVSRFNYVTKNDPVWTVGVCPVTGLVQRVVLRTNKTTGEEFHALETLSECALRIDTETIANGETEFTFKGKGAVDKREVCFTMPAGDMAVPAKFKAAVINAFGGRNQLGKLTYSLVQKLSLGIRLMLRIEVPCWRDGVPLLPGISILPNVEYRLPAQIPALVYDGDLGIAKAVLRKAMKINTSSPLLIAAILGVPVFARWFRGERFGLGIWGLTNSLKTSTVCALMSMWGTGYMDGPKLKSGRAGTTAYAATIIFAAAGWLPQLFDNVKTVDPRDAIDYVGTMNAVLEGSSKNQGTKEGSLRESKDFACTPIVTGEVRPQETATTSRVPAIQWGGVDTDILREVQMSVVTLPVIGYKWLMYLGTVKGVSREEFNKYQAIKLAEFIKAGHTVAGRTATIYAMLKTVWLLLESSPFGDVFAEKENDFMAALDELAKYQGEVTTEETEVARFMAGINELMIGNPGLFMDLNCDKHVMGAAIGKKMPEGVWLLPIETLNELAKIKTFTQIPNIDSMTEALDRERLLIHTKDDKRKYQIRMNGAVTRGWYVKLNCTPGKEDCTTSGVQQKQLQEAPCTTVPPVPPQKSEKNIPFEKGENEEDLGDKKDFDEMGGTGGTCGTEIEEREIYREIDSDIGVDSAVPPNVPPRTTFDEKDADMAKLGGIKADIQRGEADAKAKEAHDRELAEKHTKKTDHRHSSCLSCGNPIGPGYGTYFEAFCGSCGPKLAMVRAAVKARPDSLTLSRLWEDLAARGDRPPLKAHLPGMLQYLGYTEDGSVWRLPKSPAEPDPEQVGAEA